MSKFYTIYLTTNLINGKKYIGKHITNDVNDSYLGSGIALQRSIKKYGIKNFKKEILYTFDNENDMNLKESELITDSIIQSDQYYNIALGGHGGNIVLKPNHPLYETTCNKISTAQRNRSQKISKIVKELHKQQKVGMYGKTQSEKQKTTVSERLKGKKQSLDHIRNHYDSMMKTFSDPNYVHPNTGIKRSEEFKNRLKEINKSQHKKLCPWCNKQFDIRNYGRYHGDKCKMKEV